MDAVQWFCFVCVFVSGFVCFVSWARFAGVAVLAGIKPRMSVAAGVAFCNGFHFGCGLSCRRVFGFVLLLFWFHLLQPGSSVRSSYALPVRSSGFALRFISLEKRPFQAIAALTPAHAAMALSGRAGVGPFLRGKAPQVHFDFCGARRDWFTYRYPGDVLTRLLHRFLVLLQAGGRHELLFEVAGVAQWFRISMLYAGVRRLISACDCGWRCSPFRRVSPSRSGCRLAASLSQ